MTIIDRLERVVKGSNNITSIEMNAVDLGDYALATIRCGYLTEGPGSVLTFRGARLITNSQLAKGVVKVTRAQVEYQVL